MTNLPVIAITFGQESDSWRPDNDRGRYQAYAEAVRAAGGEPVRVGIDYADAVAKDPKGFLRRFQGLLLSGGPDVDPKHYPNPPASDAREEYLARHAIVLAGDARDEMELALVVAARESGLPLLAICRGMQVLNLALGGGLVPHLDGHRSAGQAASTPSVLHPVRLLPETRLCRLTPSVEAPVVNSRHHQGLTTEIKAECLRLAALSADGVVEALEDPDHPWLVGVQWHPERKKDTEMDPALSQPLFQSFVAACRGEAPR